MKNSKKLLSLSALLLGLTLVFTQSAFTSSAVTSVKETPKYWYEVVGGYTTDFAGHDVKSEMITLTGCEDDPNQDICLFGSDTELAPNSPVGTPSAENRILESEL